MTTLPEHVDVALASLGLLNVAWSVALTLFATRRADANFRRAGDELILAFGGMAAEAARAKAPEKPAPKPRRPRRTS